MINEILEKILNVDNSTLNSLDTNYMKKYNFYHDTTYYHLNSGQEHYRLLMYISTLVNDNIIYDIGTNKTMSAIALSFNQKNLVKTFDLKQYLPINPIVHNINYNLGNVLDNREEFKNVKIIFFDVDHDGTFEKIFYEFLKEIKWEGLLICDDIHLNEPMKKWWSSITEDKYDITSKGHWSGTGVVKF